jgi:prepilin-type N-terminal cleavage/methylation domain-containing protein
MSRWHPSNNCAAFIASPKRTGYTLLELVIVMAILASVAAIAWPRVRPLLRRSSHRDAALQLKADLADARQQAVLTGEVLELRVYPGTGHYSIGESSLEHPAPVLRQEATATDDDEQATPARELPDGVIFPRNEMLGRDSQPAGSLRSQTTEGARFDLPMTLASDGALAAQFYPDGRVTEAEIELLWPETNESLAVRLRGLTGGVTIGSAEQTTSAFERADDDMPLADAGSQAESLP